VGHNPGRDAKPTVARQHKYGKGGTVVPDISGGVKKQATEPKRLKFQKKHRGTSGFFLRRVALHELMEGDLWDFFTAKTSTSG
jgi:hypothetical protein